VDSPRVKEFIAELRQKISSSFYLQDVMPLEELINEISPTLICTTGDVEDCLEKLKEKGSYFCILIEK
jgi:predicted transcriptional regulator with HTH domain